MEDLGEGMLTETLVLLEDKAEMMWNLQRRSMSWNYVASFVSNCSILVGDERILLEEKKKYAVY